MEVFIVYRETDAANLAVFTYYSSAALWIANREDGDECCIESVQLIDSRAMYCELAARQT